MQFESEISLVQALGETLTDVVPELQRQYDLSATQLRELLESAERINIKSGEHWLRPGQAVDFLVLTLEGVTRVYRVDDEGTETTRGFAFSGQWITAWGEAMSGGPSRSFGQALTPVLALKIPLSFFEQKAVTDLAWARIFRQLIQKVVIAKDAREHEFMTASATQRYLDLIRSEPRLLASVSLQTLATYLGITPVALSRIRGRLSN
jgi:CRP-like cAMP-binding protein